MTKTVKRGLIIYHAGEQEEKPWKFQLNKEGKARWFKVPELTPGSERTSTPLTTPYPSAAGRPTPDFVSDSGNSAHDQTIKWEKKEEETLKGKVSAMASHHHHKVEVMPSPPYHPWHLCYPPPSCPSPAPYAYRAFAGACLGAAHPGSHPAATTTETISWRHEGEAKDCSQYPAPSSIDVTAHSNENEVHQHVKGTEAQPEATVERRRPRGRATGSRSWARRTSPLSRSSKMAAFRYPYNNPPTSSSEDEEEDALLRVRVTRSELKRLRRYK